MINFAKNTYKKILLWIPKFLLNKLSVLHYIIQVFFLSIIAVSLWLYDTPSLGKVFNSPQNQQTANPVHCFAVGSSVLG